MCKSEKCKRYWCQCLIVKCLRRIVSGLITSKNKTNEYRDFSCVWFTPQCIIFPINTQGSQKNSLERKRWWRTPRLCTLHTQALTCYARSSLEVSGHLVSFPATLWVVWPGRKNRWRKGVDIWDLVGAFSWRRSSVPKRKGKQKKNCAQI